MKQDNTHSTMELDANDLFKEDSDLTGRRYVDIGPESISAKMPGDICELEERTLKTQNDIDMLEMELSLFRGLQGWTLFYRGHSDSSYKLRPSIVREDGYDISKEDIVLKGLIEFGKSQEWDKFKIEDWDSDYFFLSIGRHLGLYCRMLDWTISLENALSFALHDNLSIKDKTLWVLAVRNYNSRYKYSNLVGLERNKINLAKRVEYQSHPDVSMRDIPKGICRRILQGGCFTIPHTDNLNEPLDELLDKYPDENIRLIKIPLIVDASTDINFEKYETNFRDILPDIPSDIQKEIDRLNKMLTIV